MHALRTSVIGITGLTMGASAFAAQPMWREIAHTAGLDGPITSSIEWDPDGDGPEQSWAAFAGTFSRAGAISCHGFIAWDGTRWRSLPKFPIADQWSLVGVDAVANCGGKLTAAYHTTESPDVIYVVALDEGNWLSLGGIPSTVFIGLHDLNGQPCITGSFPISGSDIPAVAARWTGSEWAYTSGTSANTVPRASAIFAGQLHASVPVPMPSGNFVTVWRSEASGWVPLVVDPETSTSTSLLPELVSLPDRLIAYSSNLALIDNVAVDGWASWDGAAWSESHLDFVFPPGPWDYLTIGASSTGSFLLQGYRRNGGHGVSVCGIVNSEHWTSRPSPLRYGTKHIASFRGDYFIDRGSVAPLSNVAPVRWDGNQWVPIGDGFPGSIAATGTPNRRLTIATRDLNDNQCEARIWARTNSGFVPLGERFKAASGTALIRSISEWQGRPVVAGAFSQCGSTPCAGVASWNGTEWEQLGDGLSGDPRSLVTDGSALYVFGVFGTPARARLKMLVSGLWLDAGPPLYANTLVDDTVISARAGSSLYVAVRGNTINLLSQHGLFRYSGQTWQEVRGPLAQKMFVNSIVGEDQGVLASGLLSTGGTSVTLARLSGSTWTTLRTDPVGTTTSSLPRVASTSKGLFVAQPESTNSSTLRHIDSNGQTVDETSYPYAVPSLYSDPWSLFAVSSIGTGSFATVQTLDTGCVADLAATGSLQGPDGNLSNDDLVVFIDLFFNASWRADVGGAGGSLGPDGLFDNNDFIVYIDQFFAGC